MRRRKVIAAAGLLAGLLSLAAPGGVGAKETPNCVGQIRSHEAQHLDPNLGRVVKVYATSIGAGYGQFVAGVAVSGVAPEGVEPGCS